MSKPMTLAQMKSQFDKWGVRYNVVGNPETHNRNHKGFWGDVKGGVIHHFGSASSDRTDLPLIVNGHAALPGPLSQFFLGDDNVVDIVSTGRCNHAGKGSRATFNHVVNEDYNGNLRPGPDEIDFNGYFYGVEVGYSGKEWMGDDRYKMLLLMWAAICDFHGWSAKSIIGHYELTTRKWDPGFKGARYDMAKVRNDIQILLNRGHSQSKVTVSTAQTPVVAPVQTNTKVTTASGKNGLIDPTVLRLGQRSWSVRRFKTVLFGAQGAGYKATNAARIAKSMLPGNIDFYDEFTAKVCSDTYRYWGQSDPSYLQGDLRTPGRKMLTRLGFEVK